MGASMWLAVETRFCQRLSGFVVPRGVGRCQYWVRYGQIMLERGMSLLLNAVAVCCIVMTTTLLKMRD